MITTPSLYSTVVSAWHIAISCLSYSAQFRL